MDIEGMRAAFEAVFDQEIVFHGFTDYMRDYEVVISRSADPRSGSEPEFVRFVFVNCVRANISSALPPAVWARSLDDRLIDLETARDLDGYVWGVKWQTLYPGFSVMAESEEAASWSREVGIPFREVRVDANGHVLTLVFSDLRVEPAPPGYAPFVATPD